MWKNLRLTKEAQTSVSVETSRQGWNPCTVRDFRYATTDLPNGGKDRDTTLGSIGNPIRIRRTSEDPLELNPNYLCDYGFRPRSVQLRSRD